MTPIGGPLCDKFSEGIVDTGIFALDQVGHFGRPEIWNRLANEPVQALQVSASATAIQGRGSGAPCEPEHPAAAMATAVHFTRPS
jgi:hypothetical protein